MRLKSVFISQYKNLRNFSLDFDGNSFLDVFVGKNGSGKSNLFEALIEIFRHLDESRTAAVTFPFDYRIRYEIDGTEISIEWKDKQLEVNGIARRTLGRTPLPDNIMIYYSGHNTTVPGIVNLYELTFRKKIKGANLGDSRRILRIGPDYKALLLTMLLAQPDGYTAREYIRQKLGIASVGDSILITLKRPPFARGRLKALDVDSVETFDPRTHYWGADGITREFLEKLATCIKGEFRHDNIYDRESDLYNIKIDLQLFQRNFPLEQMTEVFRQFDNLKTLGMMIDIGMPLKLAGGEDVNIEFFSDGQFQAVYIYAITVLFKDRNCLTLLDEPDAFLHPEWQFEFLKQVIEISETATQKNHVLMSSHSAATIAKASEDQIRMVEIDDSRVVTKRASKSEIIQSLSGGAISFSETEARLNIEHVLQNSEGAVVFTEGITDKLILETAWSKLYPATDRQFEVQNTFGCGFLRALFKSDDLRRNFPDRQMFALFDFDEAYNEWNGLKKGRDEITDPFSGLAKRLEYAHHYALLLPVPRVEIIKNQTLDNTGKPWTRPYLSIELLFFKEDLIGQWFKKCAMPGGGEVVEFFGNKATFAKDVIPTLPNESFEIFKDMFDFIIGKCMAGRQQGTASGLASAVSAS
jgi:ABC-type cobalamin/Fe3+-siderophores transport system ATPase subunit